MTSQTILRRNVFSTMAAMFLGALTLQPVSSQVFSDFTGGNSNMLVDAWEGTPGDGWITSWQTQTNNSTVIDVTTSNANPLVSGGGNYLQFTVTNNHGTIPLTLPSQTSWMLTIEQENHSDVSVVLGDAAVSAETIRRENNRLHIPVYNLGVAPLENVLVQLISKDGTPLAEQTIPILPAIKNWKLGMVELTFEIPQETEIHVKVKATQEITEHNNQAVVTP